MKNFKQLLNVLLITILFFTTSINCSKEQNNKPINNGNEQNGNEQNGNEQNGENKPLPIVALPDTYKLVFADEFNSRDLNTHIWGYHDLGARRDAVNVPEACLVNDNEELEIRVWTETSGDEKAHYTGIIETKENFRFGYYEARINFDDIGLGTWGAFWIMFLQNPPGGWTANDNPNKHGAEIDIVEYIPWGNRYITHTVHWNGYGTYHKQVNTPSLFRNQLYGYHVYSLLWTPEKYTFYVDGEESWSTTSGISHTFEKVLLSMEIQNESYLGYIPESGYGSFEEKKTVMYVDYVRIYQDPNVVP